MWMQFILIVMNTDTKFIHATMPDICRKHVCNPNKQHSHMSFSHWNCGTLRLEKCWMCPQMCCLEQLVLSLVLLKGRSVQLSKDFYVQDGEKDQIKNLLMNFLNVQNQTKLWSNWKKYSVVVLSIYVKLLFPMKILENFECIIDERLKWVISWLIATRLCVDV